MKRGDKGDVNYWEKKKKKKRKERGRETRGPERVGRECVGWLGMIGHANKFKKPLQISRGPRGAPRLADFDFPLIQSFKMTPNLVYFAI